MSGTLNSVYNNISFALNTQSELLLQLQEQVSTGSRVNRISDEPSTAYRILGLSSQGRSIDNYVDMLSESEGALQASSSVLQQMISTIAQTRVSITQIVSGTYGQDGRERAAEGIEGALEQLVQLANTKYNGHYLFGGGKTESEPYHADFTGSSITSVTYNGSSDGRPVEVAPGVESSAYYVGDELFRSDDRSEPVFTGDTGAAAGTGTSSVTGDVWLTVIHDGSNYRISIDNGASYVTVPAGGSANQAVTDSRTGRVLYVDSTQINATGMELVRVPGTYDLFNTLISIRDILRNERNLSEAQLEEVRKSAIDSLDEINQLLVQGQVRIGSKIGFLDNLKTGLEATKYDTEDEANRLQEADIAQVAVDLSRQQVLYQASLTVAGKLLSLSLLDFITV